ncbi:MAG: type II toxin-antitoxin system prevent-host-death family antitoxin [Propionibacteriaceae bacterium]|jgi:prevent-host-death family protein|nr:type II toxin-antitoxin system prevent-host-death family antitoxin [Propionibacteriaceae bacterium]
MTTLTVAELSRHTRDAMNEAQTAGVVVTNNGKPSALLLGIEGLDSLAIQKLALRMRADQALVALQSSAVSKGLDRWTLDDINAEIAASREERA